MSRWFKIYYVASDFRICVFKLKSFPLYLFFFKFNIQFCFSSGFSKNHAPSRKHVSEEYSESKGCYCETHRVFYWWWCRKLINGASVFKLSTWCIYYMSIRFLILPSFCFCLYACFCLFVFYLEKNNKSFANSQIFRLF